MKHLVKLSSYVGVVCAVVFCAGSATAAVFNPNTAAQLQADLVTAQNNGEDDTINLAANTTYSTADNANSPFTYNASATENNSLTVVGAGDGTTVLDGNTSTSILVISTTTPADDSDADIEVNGIVLELGLSPLGVQTNMADVLLENMEVRLNSTTFAVQSTFGTVTVNECLFENNISFQAAVLNVGGSVNFNNSTFRDNQIAILVFQLTTASLNFNANEITGNLSSSTGVLVVQSASSPIVLTNNIVTGNSILGGFGANVLVTVIDGPVTLTNNTIFDNFTTMGIGGVGIILNQDTASANFFNNIIYGNVSQGGSPSVDDIGVMDDGDANNTGSPVLLANNDFSGFLSECEDTGGCTPDVTQTDNIDSDPLFVDLMAGDFHLGAGSPCIQTGDSSADDLPATDFDGNPLNDPPDMGALAARFLLGIDPANIDYGPISTEVASPRTVTLSNEDGIAIEITDISVDDPDNFSIGDGTCGPAPFTIAGGDSCTIVVTFNPDSSGNFSAAVTITTNDPNNSTRTILVSGTGVSTGGGCTLGMGAPRRSFLLITLLVPLLLLFRRVVKNS